MPQELIALAKEVRDARKRGEEIGLTPDKKAFYDALADNQSAVDVLGNDQLKIIAHELLKGLRANVSIDWAHRDSARARLRVLVKRILRKYGYPPDLEDAAVKGVLAQAEATLENTNAKLRLFWPPSCVLNDVSANRNYSPHKVSIWVDTKTKIIDFYILIKALRL